MATKKTTPKKAAPKKAAKKTAIKKGEKKIPQKPQQIRVYDAQPERKGKKAVKKKK